MISKLETSTALPISVADLKTYLHKESADAQDTIVEWSLKAAFDHIERRTGRALGTTTFLQIVDNGWPWDRSGGYAAIMLERRPVVEVVSVAYLPPEGGWLTVSPDDYELFKSGSGRGDIRFASDYSFPTLLFDPGPAIKIEFVAGYEAAGVTGSGDDPELVLPDQFKIAALMLASHWFDNRGVIRTNENLQRIEWGADAILEKFEIFAA